MYKILLVDDETRQLKALANIIQKLRPQYEITMAEDGVMAFNEIQKKDFDMMISDIKMPNMDGLELLEKIGNKRDKMKIVIISGFAEFAYAKKCISFGVQDYIVKPIKKSDLEKMLDVIEKAIVEEGDRIQNEVNLQKKLADSLPIYLEHQLNKWIKGKSDEQGIDEISTLFPLKGEGVILLTALKGINLLEDPVGMNIRQDIKLRIKVILNDVGHSISFFLEENKEIMVTIINAEQSIILTSYDHERRLVDFIDFLKNDFEIVGTIGISAKTSNIFEEVTQCFSQAQTALDKKFYMNMDKIIHYKSEDIQQTMKTWNTDSLEKELSEAIGNLDSNHCYQITNKAAKDQCPSMEPEDLKEVLLLLMLNLVKVLRNAMTDEDYHAFKESIKMKINNCDDYKELWHSINGVVKRIIENLSLQRKDINGVIIQKCKKFIEENYKEDITLELIAQKYHFSNAYFGNLFKEYTDQSFSKYLTNVRLKDAQNLLITTEFSMSYISQNVGISDAAYFNRIFKREFGISPNKYRQMNARK